MEAELKMDTYTGKTKQIGIKNESIVNFFESWSLHTRILYHFYNVSWLVAKDSRDLATCFCRSGTQNGHIYTVNEAERMVPIMKLLSDYLKLWLYTKWWFSLINNDVSCSGCPGWSQKILETLLHVSIEAELKMDTYTWKTKQIDVRNKIIVNCFEPWPIHKMMFCPF